MTYQDLYGKRVLITGGNGGLGRQLIQDFAAEKSDLIVHARQFSNEFNDWLLEIEAKFNVHILRLNFDLTDNESLKNSFRSLPVDFQIDVLINNAGAAHGGLTMMTPVSDVRKIFEVNYFSQVELTQLVLRRMVRQQCGRIINISSISGLDSKSGNVAYGASKAALIAFTRTLSSEVGRFGIRVNCVAPGLIDTEMATLMEDKALRIMIDESGMKRMATTSEIAKVVLFLSSDYSSFINGQTIRVDGGVA